ncbi:hypothetical protein TanjilG_30830 [Lupinus angustifolius]|uniref:Uncharacterized protein n=1 Tax=Lupinus angustifolius TaxID=3871 RepID=A0A1J7HQS2_LUPAN|nr:hypothetical protein TanjilG_30830 [Lupinus angustifolius]
MRQVSNCHGEDVCALVRADASRSESMRYGLCPSVNLHAPRSMRHCQILLAMAWTPRSMFTRQGLCATVRVLCVGHAGASMAMDMLLGHNSFLGHAYHGHAGFLDHACLSKIPFSLDHELS